MQNSTQIFIWIGLGFGVLGLVVLLAGLAALRARRPLGFTLRLGFGAALLAVGALTALLGLSTLGYQAFTREETAARIWVQPVAPQEFAARFLFPDGREAAYVLRGDQIYVDAHVLKWKPVANLIGLHTAYELDRVAGRYITLDRERSYPRTVHALGADKVVDIFDLRTRHAALSPLLDVEYGSATFAPADRPAVYEVRISTTGLLIRPVQP